MTWWLLFAPNTMCSLLSKARALLVSSLCSAVWQEQWTPLRTAVFTLQADVVSLLLACPAVDVPHDIIYGAVRHKVRDLESPA